MLGVGLSMYYEWSLGLLALAFTPFILVATYLQRKVMAQENMGTANTMEKCTKVRNRFEKSGMRTTLANTHHIFNASLLLKWSPTFVP